MGIEIHLKDEYILAGQNFVIDEENKQKLKTLIFNFIIYVTEIEPVLDISDLKNLYVPKDYSKEVIDFQRHHQLVEGITDNKIAKGYGISLSHTDDFGKIVTSIFISSEIILPLFTLNMELKDKIPLFNVIYHELCHIDDHKKLSKLSITELIKQNNVMDKLLYVLSLEVWEEYYAHRRSSKVFPYIYFDTFNFQLILQEFKFQSTTLIKEYQIDGNLEIFVEKFYHQTSTLFKTSARVLGDHFYLSQEGDPLLDYKMIPNEFNFASILDELNVSLMNLFNQYPNWEGIDVLIPLRESILNLWFKLGVTLTRIDEHNYYVGINPPASLIDY